MKILRLTAQDDTPSSPVSRLPSPVSRLPSPVSRLPSPVSASRFPLPASRFPIPDSRCRVRRELRACSLHRIGTDRRDPLQRYAELVRQLSDLLGVVWARWSGRFGEWPISDPQRVFVVTARRIRGSCSTTKTLGAPENSAEVESRDSRALLQDARVSDHRGAGQRESRVRAERSAWSQGGSGLPITHSVVWKRSGTDIA